MQRHENDMFTTLFQGCKKMTVVKKRGLDIGDAVYVYASLSFPYANQHIKADIVFLHVTLCSDLHVLDGMGHLNDATMILHMTSCFSSMISCNICKNYKAQKGVDRFSYIELRPQTLSFFF